MSKLTIKLKLYQDNFLFSTKRFPALVAGIGTGKTMMLLLKIWQFCEQYPNSLALIVRKEYTDLKDSTIKDFQRYFNVTPDSNKEYKFKNGSVIMFRHGAEINVLKNINLSIAGIEQAEEFETEETFIFLRDRLRRDNAPYRQLCIIANTNGHNWIWKYWRNAPSSDDYFLQEAKTFDNFDNLPQDFVADLHLMQKDSPAHYRRYVENSWEEEDVHDILLPFSLLEQSVKKEFTPTGRRILACDPAEFGDDETVFTIIQCAGLNWKQVWQLALREQDLMNTVGRIMDINYTERVDKIVVDRVGIGAGVVSRLQEQLGSQVVGFHGGEASTTTFDFAGKNLGKPEFYNQKAEKYFLLKHFMQQGKLQIENDNTLLQQLNAIKYEYSSDGRKKIVSKDKMKAKGIPSPDRADALMMAVGVITNSDYAMPVSSGLRHTERVSADSGREVALSGAYGMPERKRLRV